MTIRNSTLTDIDQIFHLYALASAHQKAVGSVVVWPTFERSLVEGEIAANHQWKLVMEGEIACVWATTFSDAQIWEERDTDPAVYIHRIATNPNFRGQNFVGIIVDWAKTFAQSNAKTFVRLDTLGNNTKLIAHYTSAGFEFLGFADLKNTDGLPSHYKEAPAALFEMRL